MSHTRFNTPTGSSSDEDVLETPIREVEDSSSDEDTDDVLTKPVTEVCVLKSVPKRSRERNEAEASTDVKRVKRVSGEEEKKSGGGEETKKAYFQRVWSEDDEIDLLQGLVDYENINGVSLYDNITEVYQLVKTSISFDVSKVQFTEKLRSLKRKYENNLVKAKNADTFAKSHDRKVFELSKIVWGAIESAVKSSEKSKRSLRKTKKVELDGKNEDMFPKSSLASDLTHFGMDEFAAQQGLSCLASEDKKMLEEEWKALKVREFEFYLQKSCFLREVVAKMVEAFRSNV